MKEDAQLIDETLAGGAASFGEIVLRYQDRLYNAVVHLVGAPDEALDVVQDAFVQAFLKLESFQRNSAFYTWLYRIAFNLAMSRRRRQRPTVSLEQAHDDAGAEPLARNAEPSGRMEQCERAAQVQAALSRLSEEHRAVLVLREIDGCCYETIAEVMGAPVGTVRSRLHRARMALREELRAVLQED